MHWSVYFSLFSPLSPPPHKHEFHKLHVAHLNTRSHAHMQCSIVWPLAATLSSLLCVVSGAAHAFTTHGFTTHHACRGAYSTDSVTTAESMQAQVHASQDFRTIRHWRHEASAASPDMLLLLDPRRSAKCATISYDVEIPMPRVFRELMGALHIEGHRPVHVEKQVCVQGGRSVVQTTSVSDYVLSGVRVRTHTTFPDANTMQSVVDLRFNVPWYAVVLRSKILDHLKQTLERGVSELAVSLCGATRTGCRQEMPAAQPMLYAANLSALARDLIMTKYFA